MKEQKTLERKVFSKSICFRIYTRKLPIFLPAFILLSNAGYISSTNPTSGKIYIKLTGGHPPGSTISADHLDN